MSSEMQRESRLAFTQAIKSLESYNHRINGSGIHHVPGAILRGIRHSILSEAGFDPEVAASIISNNMPFLGSPEEILKKLGFETGKETRIRLDKAFKDEDLYRENSEKFQDEKG